jgi:hypothetical protein
MTPHAADVEKLAALSRTLITLVCRLGEEVVDATERCADCTGTAACDACFAAIQTTMRYHRLARDIEAHLGGMRATSSRRPVAMGA